MGLRAMLPASAFVLGAYVLSYSGEIVRGVAFHAEDHAAVSLDMAVHRSVCGVDSAMSGRYTAAAGLSRLGSEHVPLRDLAVERFGGRDGLCQSLYPMANAENSLMLIERAALGWNHRASAVDIGRVLVAIRIAGCAAFVLGLLACGAPVVFCTAVFAVTVAMLHSLDPFFYSQYPLIMPVIAAHVAFYLWAGRLRWAATAMRHAGALAIAGIFAAFTVNLRSSTVPLTVALAVCYVEATRRGGLHAVIRWYGLSAAAFALGYLAFTATFIRPLERAVPRQLVSVHHVIAHPLVLSLAVPPNEFASNAGIEWKDSAGLALAQRIDPSTTYLGPSYEANLFRFYVTLWRTHPRDMLYVYAVKGRTAGRSLIDALATLPHHRLWMLVAAPMLVIRNGWVLLIVLSAVAIAGWRRLGDAGPWSLPVAMVAVLAVLSQLEATVLVPIFTPQYHSIHLFALAFLCLAGYQLAMTAMWRSLRGRA